MIWKLNNNKSIDYSQLNTGFAGKPMTLIVESDTIIIVNNTIGIIDDKDYYRVYTNEAVELLRKAQELNSELKKNYICNYGNKEYIIELDKKQNFILHKDATYDRVYHELYIDGTEGYDRLCKTLEQKPKKLLGDIMRDFRGTQEESEGKVTAKEREEFIKKAQSDFDKSREENVNEKTKTKLDKMFKASHLEPITNGEVTLEVVEVEKETTGKKKVRKTPVKAVACSAKSAKTKTTTKKTKSESKDTVKETKPKATTTRKKKSDSDVVVSESEVKKTRAKAVKKVDTDTKATTKKRTSKRVAEIILD